MQNLVNLKKALNILKAKQIFIPSLIKEYLDKGHACHFRCFARDVENLRIDIMSKLKGCDNFEKLWERRYIIKMPNRMIIEVISLEDLVQCKKTQRDKDWFMINRLIENDMFKVKRPSKTKIKWWLNECRDAEKLIKLSGENIKLAKESIKQRALLKFALKKDVRKLKFSLYNEEMYERNKDIKYWEPLKKELGILRHKVILSNINT